MRSRWIWCNRRLWLRGWRKGSGKEGEEGEGSSSCSSRGMDCGASLLAGGTEGVGILRIDWGGIGVECLGCAGVF